MNGNRLAHNQITAPSYFLLLLLTLAIAGCSSEKLGPDVSAYGVGALERAMADFTPTYYEPANAEEAEQIAKRNRQVIEAVKRLIREGAMVNHQRSGNGHTPLHVAVQLASIQLTQILLDAGARTDLRAETSRGPMTPLEYADFLTERVPGYEFAEGMQLLRRAIKGERADGKHGGADLREPWRTKKPSRRSAGLASRQCSGYVSASLGDADLRPLALLPERP